MTPMTRWLWCAGFLFVTLNAGAQAAVVLAANRSVSFDAMLDSLAKADVVFIGEQHDHAQGHALELAIFKGLADRRQRVALAMEMFERDVQPILDEYLRGLISESSFTAAARPW